LPISKNLSKRELDQFADKIWDIGFTGKALVSRDGTILSANKMFCTITEYTEYELQQRKFQDFTIPNDVEADEEMARRVADGRAYSYDMVKHYITKSNVIIQVALRVSRLEKEDGTFDMFLSEITPLTHVGDKTANIIKPNLTMMWWRRNWAMIAGWTAALGAGLAAFLDKWPFDI